MLSYLTSRTSSNLIVAARQAITAEWWEMRHQEFDLYVSALVVSEAEDGDPEAVERRRAAMKDLPALSVSNEAKVLGERLIDDGPMPEEYPEDALHVAVCALNGIDYLLTWNCTHLANAQLRRQVERFLDEAGYECPIICTPEELMEV